MNVIHVTGTKGKGSTCALTQSVLHNWTSPDGKPLKTGLFTSPHLVAMRERIRIDGAPISEDLFAKYTEDVWNRLEATKDQAAYLQNSQDPKKVNLSRNDEREKSKTAGGCDEVLLLLLISFAFA
jgi:folylpolyglutamate synthase